MTGRETHTPETFREDIRAAELLASRIRPGVSRDDLLALLERLDDIATGYRQLRVTSIDLRPELTQIETIHNILDDQAGVVVRRLGGAEGLVELRRQRQSTEERWWWYLDRRVAARRQGRIRRIAWMAGGAILLLAVLGFLYVRFLRPDEATRERYGYVLSGESALDRGEYEAALESYQSALEIAPDDPEANLMFGLLNEALEHPEEAAKGYARAEALYDSRALFLAVRSQKYTFVGWYEKAEADAQAAVEADDQLALAYCALGGAVEGQGRIREAIDAFQACADQARARDENELYVIAATRLGMLLQMPSPLDSPVTTPQPEGE